MTRTTFRPNIERLENRTLLATCTVTNLLDVGRGGMSIGTGLVTGDLRFCINHTNNLPGDDTIGFTVQGTIKLNRALPDLDGDLTINGPGNGLLSIDPQQKARVFYIEEGVNVTISGLTMKNGKDIHMEGGGAVYNEGTLELHDCIVTENVGFSKGGGIYNAGMLSVYDTVVSQNYVVASEIWNWGGGLYNANTGTLIIYNSTISGNEIQPRYSGRAIGAGIANIGVALIFDSAIVANFANLPSIATWGGLGGGIYNDGDIVVHSTLIAKNVVGGDYFALGGGIANGGLNAVGDNFLGGNVWVNNSTIADNLATAIGDEGYGDALGGGICSINGGTVDIQNSTIALNRLDRYHTYVRASGAGIANVWPPKSGSAVVNILNSIVADNLAITGGNDLDGVLSSSGYNLIGDSVGGTGYAETDLLDIDPLLGPPQNNGGPTKTLALLPGSPAIDAGDNTDAPEWDQRGPGFPRIVNGTIDIGAFEVQSTGAASRPHFLAFLITADDQDEQESIP